MDQDQIKIVANLARLEITDDNIAETTESLSNILKLVDQMQSVDTDNIEPMAHPMDAIQRLRADIVTEKNQRDELQTNAPATENGLFLVPKVIETED